MPIARTIAAAALAVGLTAGLAPAALAASHSTAAPAHSASAHHGKKPAKDQVKLDLHADDSCTAGDTLTLKGRLTHRTKKGFKPVADKAVTLSLLDPAGSTVLGEATTNAKGRYTLTYATTMDQAGSNIRFAASFAGDATVKAATSKAITITLEAADDGTDDGTEDGSGGDETGRGEQ